MDKKKSIINIQDLGLSADILLAGSQYYELFTGSFLFLESFYYLREEVSYF
jgi:hypothetical protein